MQCGAKLTGFMAPGSAVLKGANWCGRSRDYYSLLCFIFVKSGEGGGGERSEVISGLLFFSVSHHIL